MPLDNDEIARKLDNLSMQVHRLQADQESEKGTAIRRGERIARQIGSLDKKFDDMFYGEDRKSGIVVDLDRLKQFVKSADKFKWIVIGSIVTSLALLFKEAIKLIFK